MGVGLVYSIFMATPLWGCKNEVSPSNQVVDMISSASHKQTVSLGSITFLLIARTLCVSKLIYGLTHRLYVWKIVTEAIYMANIW